MGRLRVLSGREVCRIPAEDNFAEVRRRGSHIILQTQVAGDTITVPVPDHEELRTGTLLGIIRQSRLLRSLIEVSV